MLFYFVVNVRHAHSRQVHDVGTAYVVVGEKMASVSEMYDVGWEGKTKDKTRSPQVSLRHILIFTAFDVSLVFLLCKSVGESRRRPRLKIRADISAWKANAS